jgi:YVTN family beta-propeller protein
MTTRGFFRRSVLLTAIAACLASLGALAASAGAAPLAYTANYEGNSVSVINTATNAVVGKPIPVGKGPASVAVTPDGKRAYVTNFTSGDVSVIETAKGEALPGTIKVGEGPEAIAISPDGKTAYVADLEGDEVIEINLQTNLVVREFSGIVEPVGIAVAPDGKSVWVTSRKENDVWVLDPARLEPIGKPIPVGLEPQAVIFSPDGKTAYVSDTNSEEVSTIDTATHLVGGFKAGAVPWGLAITPDGKKLFVANNGDDTVEAIETATGKSQTIEVGKQPFELGMTPNGKVVYVADFESEYLDAIDTQTVKFIGSPIELKGQGPWQVTVAPDQSPTAAFTAPSATVGVPTAFSGAASSDPDGTVAGWSWLFGDGGSATGVAPSNTFAAAGIFNTKLSVVDNEGCGEAEVFTGRTAFCSGNLAASVTHPVTVAKSPEAVTVTTQPSNAFRFGRVVHNLGNGTVRMQVTLPSAGFVFLFGKKVHAVKRKSTAKQTMWLTIHARVELAKKLKKTLRAPVSVRITFTPNGGTPRTVHRTVTLQRRPHKKPRHPRAHAAA